MRMPREHIFHPDRGSAGRDVFEVKKPSRPLQTERQRPAVVVVVITPDHQKRPARLLQLGQNRRLANIAQVPNLIGFRQTLDQRRRQAVMGIGDHGHAQRAHGGRNRVADIRHTASCAQPPPPRNIPHSRQRFPLCVGKLCPHGDSPGRRPPRPTADASHVQLIAFHRSHSKTRPRTSRVRSWRASARTSRGL